MPRKSSSSPLIPATTPKSNSYILSKSSRANKKMMVQTPSGKIVHFGAAGYSDYTIHKDKERRARYWARHARHENWSDLESAGFWAKEILWGQSPIINECIKYIENKFHIHIIYKK